MSRNEDFQGSARLAREAAARVGVPQLKQTGHGGNRMRNGDGGQTERTGMDFDKVADTVATGTELPNPNHPTTRLFRDLSQTPGFERLVAVGDGGDIVTAIRQPIADQEPAQSPGRRPKSEAEKRRIRQAQRDKKRARAGG